MRSLSTSLKGCQGGAKEGEFFSEAICITLSNKAETWTFYCTFGRFFVLSRVHNAHGSFIHLKSTCIVYFMATNNIRGEKAETGT